MILPYTRKVARAEQLQKYKLLHASLTKGMARQKARPKRRTGPRGLQKK